MTVDLSKIKPGDELTIRVRARVRGSDGWTIRALHDDMGTLVKDEHIVSHTPKALAVGDRVRSSAGGLASFVGPIIAIHGEWAWLGDPADTGIIRRLSSLERVDA